MIVPASAGSRRLTDDEIDALIFAHNPELARIVTAARAVHGGIPSRPRALDSTALSEESITDSGKVGLDFTPKAEPSSAMGMAATWAAMVEVLSGRARKITLDVTGQYSQRSSLDTKVQRFTGTPCEKGFLDYHQICNDGHIYDDLDCVNLNGSISGTAFASVAWLIKPELWNTGLQIARCYKDGDPPRAVVSVSPTIVKGQQSQARVTNCSTTPSWLSSDPSIATVRRTDGLVFAQDTGTVRIGVDCGGMLRGSATIRVKAPSGNGPGDALPLPSDPGDPGPSGGDCTRLHDVYGDPADPTTWVPVGDWYFDCTIRVSTVHSVPLTIATTAGTCTPWGTSDPAVATMNSAGVITSTGAGVTYRIVNCGNQFRATPTYVRSPTDPNNVTNGGCSDGYGYDVMAAANGTWWELGASCLGGGVPVQTNVNPTAAPTSLARVSLSSAAIRPIFYPQSQQCYDGAPNMCAIWISNSDDMLIVDPRHPTVYGGELSIVGGSVASAGISYPITVKWRYNGTVVKQETIASPIGLRGSSQAPQVNMPGFQDGDIVAVSAEVTDNKGNTLTTSSHNTFQSPPDPGDLAVRVRGNAKTATRGDRMRKLREYVKQIHRAPTDAEYRQYMGEDPPGGGKP